MSSGRHNVLAYIYKARALSSLVERKSSSKQLFTFYIIISITNDLPVTKH